MDNEKIIQRVDNALSELLEIRAYLTGNEPQALTKKGKKKKRVITYGTYDMIHAGHIRFLKRAKELGDELIVAVSTDEINAFKHKEARIPFVDRYKVLQNLEMVDYVIAEDNWEQKRSDMHKYEIDIFVIAEDWRGEFDYLEEEGVQVVYLPRTPDISTTKLKKGISLSDREKRNKEAFAELNT